MLTLKEYYSTLQNWRYNVRTTILLLIILIASPIPAKQNRYNRMIGTWYYITDGELYPVSISKKEKNYYLRWVMPDKQSEGLDSLFGPILLAPILQYNRMFKVKDGYECSVFIMNEKIYHHVYFKENKLYLTLNFIKNQKEEAGKEKQQRQKEALKHKSRIFELTQKNKEEKTNECRRIHG